MTGGVQYITGDPNDPHYRSDHGGGNYHDHLGFSSPAVALRAYNFFSKKFKVTQFKPITGVTGIAHNTPGDPHYESLAFDIPGNQWGGSGAIGPTEYRGSAKVRAALKEFLGQKAMAKGGRVRKPTQALIGEKGPEFVFDADTTEGLDSLAPGLLDLLNAAKTKRQIASIINSYASYEDGAEQTIIVSHESQMVPVPVPVPTGSGGGIVIGSGSRDNSYDALYYGH